MSDSAREPSLMLASRAAIVSALVAGTTIILFTIAGQHSSPFALFEGITRIAFPAQSLAPRYAMILGGMIHYGVSLGWALGYALMARNTTALLKAPLLSGLSFGIVVELTMDSLLVMIGTFHPPTPTQFLRDLIAHTIGFGIPLAFTASRLMPIGAL